MSKFISVLAARLADIVNSPFYDDFSQLEYEVLAESAHTTFTRVFEIMGFQLAVEEHKCKPFSSVFDPLGVRLDLSEAPQGRIKLSAKPGRLEEVSSLCRGYLGADSMERKGASCGS